MKTTKQSVDYLRMMEAENPRIRKGNANIRQSEIYVSDIMVLFTNSGTIHDKVAELQQHFIDKIVTCDFEVIKFEVNYCQVQIEGQYNFNIWIGNGSKYCRVWGAIGDQFMQLPDFTDEQQVKVFEGLSELYIKNTELIKAEKVARLKKELTELES